MPILWQNLLQFGWPEELPTNTYNLRGSRRERERERGNEIKEMVTLENERTAIICMYVCMYVFELYRRKMNKKSPFFYFK